MSLVECWNHYFWDRQACNNSAAYLFLPHIASILTSSGFWAGCYPPQVRDQSTALEKCRRRRWNWQPLRSAAILFGWAAWLVGGDHFWVVGSNGTKSKLRSLTRVACWWTFALFYVLPLALLIHGISQLFRKVQNSSYLVCRTPEAWNSYLCSAFWQHSKLQFFQKIGGKRY